MRSKSFNKRRIYFSILIVIIILISLYIFSSLYRSLIGYFITSRVSQIVTTLSSATVIPNYIYDISVESLQDIVQTGQSTSANITITNNGVYEGDVNIIWWIEDSYGTNYTFSSTIANIFYGRTWSSTKSLLVPSSALAGIYYFKVNLNVDDYSSIVYDTFEVQIPVTTTIPAGGGGPPVNVSKKEVTEPEKIVNLEVLYDKELIVFPGIPKIYEIKIKNSGDLNLHNLNLHIQGIELSWFFVNPDTVNLTVNESVKFKINYSLPASAEIKKYPISILFKNNEVEKKVYLTLNVIEILDKTELENRLDNLEKKIDNLEEEIDELRDKGFPVDSFYRLLYDAKGRLELAKKEMEIGNLKKASELIEYAEITIDSIEDTISEITPVQTRIVWSTLLITIIIVVVFLLSVKIVEKEIKKIFKYIGRTKL